MLDEATLARRDLQGDLWPERLCFWLGLPAVLGLFSGWNAIGVVAPYLPLAWAMIYWLLLSFIMWAGLGAGTALVDRPLRRIGLPLLVRLLLGALLGVLITRPFHAAFQHLFAPLADPVPVPSLPPPLPQSPRDWRNLYVGNALLVFFWAGGGLFFARFMRYVPFAGIAAPAIAPPSAVAAPPAGPLARLMRLPARSIEVCRAEDHYVRLSGPAGDELLLYRFADAAAELGAQGWHRVHRSACVRDDAVRAVQRRGRHLVLTMRGGAEVPVSERYRALVDRIVANRGSG